MKRSLRKMRHTLVEEGRSRRRRVATLTEERLMTLSEKQKLLSHELQSRLTRAQHQISAAEERGAQRFLRAEYLDEQIREMRVQLVRILGDEMAPHLDRLVAASRKRWPDMLNLDVRIPLVDRRATIIRGSIPELNYNFYVME